MTTVGKIPRYLKSPPLPRLCKTHEWMAPACKGFCGGFGGLVGCGHMSGPFARRIMAAGPDGVRGSGPDQEFALKQRVELSGSS
jgi:hypothetical protein